MTNSGASIATCLKRAASLAAVSDSPRLDLELLLAHAIERDRTYLFTWPERLLTPAQLQTFETALARRQQGEPVAHIIGKRDFWSLTLAVDDSTLIPRPETELVVEAALDLPLAREKAIRVLDLGCGTGAIGLALAVERPAWKILAVDKSEQAVALAERNRRALAIENVRVQQSDWFSDIDPVDFDVILSNPPYIDAQDDHLQQGDLRFEPRTALVADEQGMADLVFIIQQAANRNRRGFWLLLEHGWQQGEVVRSAMTLAGFEAVMTHRDLNQHERVTQGRFEVSN